MSDSVQTNAQEVGNKQVHYKEHDSSYIDISRLSNCVVAAAKNVYQELVPGLPKSVYQLKLFNCLTRQGFQLNTELSMLSQCADNELCRDIIIVNGVLVIECIVDDVVLRHYQRRIMFDLQNNDYAVGLLINFSESMQDNAITIVKQNAVSH